MVMRRHKLSGPRDEREIRFMIAPLLRYIGYSSAFLERTEYCFLNMSLVNERNYR